MEKTLEIVVKGLESTYEIEHLARIFYPHAALRAGAGTRGSLVYAFAGRCRLAAGVRLADGRRHVVVQRAPDPGQDRQFALSCLLYGLLCRQTGMYPPWGMLTGVRPVNYLRRQLTADGEEGARDFLVRQCDVSPEKYALSRQIVAIQQPVLEALPPRSYSLYISIPFCPTRCSYCSFVSRSIQQEARFIQPYLEKLVQELELTAQLAGQAGLALQSIYIGGGTPTVLDLHQLDTLLAGVAKYYDTSAVKEYTVEAGRPDCTDYDKLKLLKQYGVGRISINPQSLSDTVLKAIGRSHTAADVLRCYADARRAGHSNINMDLIAGLPQDTEESFASTLRTVLELEPENITLHTLTLKRASDIRKQEEGPAPSSPLAMLKMAYPAFRGQRYYPYYLYRQKSGLENLENTGWTKPGFEGLYNIYIMEEVHSILAVGAGASTKLVAPDERKINRIYNVKFPADYIRQFDQILIKKREVLDFYAGDMDSETFG